MFFTQVLLADSEYERKGAKGNFRLEEWFYFVITMYFKAAAQHISDDICS